MFINSNRCLYVMAAGPGGGVAHRKAVAHIQHFRRLDLRTAPLVWQFFDITWFPLTAGVVLSRYIFFDFCGARSLNQPCTMAGGGTRPNIVAGPTPWAATSSWLATVSTWAQRACLTAWPLAVGVPLHRTRAESTGCILPMLAHWTARYRWQLLL